MPDQPNSHGGWLKLEDIAKLAGCSRRKVTEWASDRQPFARRLRVVRLGHSFVRVRPADWLKFQEANANF